MTTLVARPVTRVGPTPDGLVGPTPGPTNTPLPPPDGAAGFLVAMADLIEPSPTDATSGNYAYLELRYWSRGGPNEIVAFDERRWRADDGSGRVITRRLPAQSVKTFTLSQIPSTDFTKAKPNTTNYMPGEMTWGIHGPVPTAPEDMAILLNGGFPGEAPPQVQIQFFTDLYEWNHLGRDSRAAALRALSVLDGLRYEGNLTDQAGRAGVGVSLTVAGTRQLLILNRRTGELLAFERSVPGYLIDDYRLYVRHDRRTTLT